MPAAGAAAGVGLPRTMRSSHNWGCPARQEPFAEQVVDVLVARDDEAEQGPVDHLAAFHAQQVGGSEVSFQDQSCFIEGQIAHRRELVEVEVPGARGGDFLLRPAQLLVLHLELDLVHLQLVEQTQGFLEGNARAGLR